MEFINLEKVTFVQNLKDIEFQFNFFFDSLVNKEAFMKIIGFISSIKLIDIAPGYTSNGRNLTFQIQFCSLKK